MKKAQASSMQSTLLVLTNNFFFLAEYLQNVSFLKKCGKNRTQDSEMITDDQQKDLGGNSDFTL